MTRKTLLLVLLLFLFSNATFSQLPQPSPPSQPSPPGNIGTSTSPISPVITSTQSPSLLTPVATSSTAINVPPPPISSSSISLPTPITTTNLVPTTTSIIPTTTSLIPTTTSLIKTTTSLIPTTTSLISTSPTSQTTNNQTGSSTVLSSSRYGKCGQLETFNSFNVWYSKKHNKIAFNATGTSSLDLSDRHAKLFVYFDPSHIFFVDRPICSFFNNSTCVFGEITDLNFSIASIVDTQFISALPDIIFDVPGTGSFAILTLTASNQSKMGCAYASVGNPDLVKSNIVSGISAGIAILSALLIIMTWNSKLWQARNKKEKQGDPKNPDKHFSKEEYNDPQNPLAFWSDYQPNTPSSVATSQNLLKFNRPSDDNFWKATTQPPSLEDFFSIAQWIVITGLLALPTLPIGYRQFASNFRWLFGIFTQSSFTRLRNRICPIFLSDCLDFAHNPAANDGSSNCTFEKSLALDSDMRPPEKLFASNNISSAPYISSHVDGISVYASVLHIQTYDLFFTVLMIFLIAIALVIFLVGFMGLIGKFYKKWDIGQSFHLYVLAAILRLVLLLYQPITLLAIYQLTIQNDCWTLRLLPSLVICIFSIGAIMFCGYKIIHAYNSNSIKLWETNEYRIVYSRLYHNYLENRVLFFIPHVAIMFLRPLAVALLRNGICQLAVLGILECAYILLIVRYQPFDRKSTNRMNIGLAIIRVITIIMLVPFIGTEKMVSSVSRIQLTIALITLQSLTIGFMTLLILLRAGVLIWTNAKKCCHGGNVSDISENNHSFDVEQEMRLYTNIRNFTFTNANDTSNYTEVNLTDDDNKKKDSQPSIE
ncbi:4592_t:CDS:2 [Ambispora leptoticha]|uniref:4592_t:CDS:1 n=1 Tax=Ambispora leptoticha TaxID=144679 RepID=A0A9N8ZTK0_9GLOM|nr:4592_t:CDS:2 [Ambispora leptoticha]